MDGIDSCVTCFHRPPNLSSWTQAILPCLPIQTVVAAYIISGIAVNSHSAVRPASLAVPHFPSRIHLLVVSVLLRIGLLLSQFLGSGFFFLCLQFDCSSYMRSVIDGRLQPFFLRYLLGCIEYRTFLGPLGLLLAQAGIAGSTTMPSRLKVSMSCLWHQMGLLRHLTTRLQCASSLRMHFCTAVLSKMATRRQPLARYPCGESPQRREIAGTPVF